MFYQNTTEQTRPFAPNTKAAAIQSQLQKVFGHDITIFCSNDEAMLFFTFKEQIEQASRFMEKKIGGSTMLIQSGYTLQMPGMSLVLFICQAQSNMNFILVAGGLIIESLAVAGSATNSIDYTWMFQAYQQTKLPIPQFCLTELNEPIYRAMRKAWPKTLHGWASHSIIRHGLKILQSDSVDEDVDRDQISNEFTAFVKNHTKTSKVFQQKFKQLKNQVKEWQSAKARSFLAFMKRIKEN